MTEIHRLKSAPSALVGEPQFFEISSATRGNGYVTKGPVPGRAHAGSGCLMMNPAPIKPQISFEHLDAVDIRVGTIMSVRDIPRSEKLVALRVSFGDQERTIVAGLKKERTDPREIEGKQALFVVNLAPRKMKGVLSEGMMFDIGYADGLDPVLAVPEAPVPNGSRAG